MNGYGKFTNFSSPMDHREMMGVLDGLSERFSFLGIISIGESMLGRTIPLVTLGEGEKSVLYVGAHSGGEWRTSLFLLRFLQEMCEWFEGDACAFRHSVKYLLATRTLYVVPMLNPDGVEYHLHGVEKEHILYDRLIKMNGHDEDFSSWQANGRGIDLRHNYPCGFFEYRAHSMRAGLEGGCPEGYGGEIPESEPEVRGMAKFVRTLMPKAVLSLHTPGGQILSSPKDARTARIAARIADAVGYKSECLSSHSAYGGLCDYTGTVLGIPSFTVKLGRGKNPLPNELYPVLCDTVRKIVITLCKNI